jgi:hypothetical protein
MGTQRSLFGDGEEKPKPAKFQAGPFIAVWEERRCAVLGLPKLAKYPREATALRRVWLRAGRDGALLRRAILLFFLDGR